MKYTALIIDDEQDAIELIEYYLAKFFPQIEIIGKGQYIDDIIQLLTHKKPDILFLDIEIHGLTSFEILKRIKLAANTNILFVTAHGKYALEAFGFDATSYLLKPIVPLKFKNAIEKVMIRIEDHWALNKAQEKLNNQFSIPQSKRFKLVDLNQILYCQAEGAYTNFFVVNENKLTASKPLKYIKEKLPLNQFIRVHQSYLINITHINEYNYSENIIILSNGTQIPVSRRFKKGLKELFKDGFIGINT